MARSAWWRRARRHFSIDAPRTAGLSRTSWPWRAILGALLLALIAAMWSWGLDFGALFGGVDHEDLEARLAVLETQKTELEKDNAALRAKTMQQESELAMASGAQVTLSREAHELAAENAQVKEELAFLQQLVADSNKGAGLSIQRLAVERESADEWRYRFLLVRGGGPKDEFTGQATLQVTLQAAPADGSVPRSGTLSLPSDQPGSEASLMLKFKYYQRVEGTIAVAAGAQVRAVTVRVFEAGQPAPRATRSLVIP